MNPMEYSVLLDDLILLEKIADSYREDKTIYKLQVAKAYNGMHHLEISSGDASSNAGWIRQVAARNYANITGSAGASRKEIIAYLKQLMVKAASFLQNPSHGCEFYDSVQIASLINERLNLLRDALVRSQKGIEFLKAIYPDKRSQKDLTEINGRISEFVHVNFRIAKKKWELDLHEIAADMDNGIRSSQELLLEQQKQLFAKIDGSPMQKRPQNK